MPLMRHAHHLPLVLLAATLILGGCISFGDEKPEVPPPKSTQASPSTAAPAQPACAGKALRKVLVTAFPLRYPEQIHSGEYMGWAQTTGEELARLLERNGRLRVAALPERFPFVEAGAAPEVERDARGKPRITAWATQEHAQYVIAGVIRDFGTANKWQVVPERQLAVDAYIYDGISGVLLARQEFSHPVLLDGKLPKNVTPGTREFAASRLGAAYSGLLTDISRWAEDTITCQPFTAHITRIEERRLTLDAGSTLGIATGMELSASASPAPTGNVPAGRRPPNLVVKEVLPDSCIAEVPQQRNPPKFQVGDVLYVVGK